MAVRIVAGADALARAAADEWRTRALAAASGGAGRFAVALSGGSTPRAFYELLSDEQQPYGDGLPWERTHVFFGDERPVPPGHPESNYGMVRRALLARVPIPPENVHRIHGEDAPDLAARAYETELRSFFGGPPRFDLLFLGLGADGHTASLFPGVPAEGGCRFVAAPFVPALGTRRITLTERALRTAAHVVFLVSGASKAPVLARVLGAEASASELPASRVRPLAGTVLWLVDRAAAAEMKASG